MSIQKFFILWMTSHALCLLTFPSASSVDFAHPSQTQQSRSIRIKESKKVGATSEQMRTGKSAAMQLWAVVIGVSTFKYGDQEVDGNLIRNLKYADQDAQAVYDFLRSPEGGGFRDQAEGGHMILLKNEQATKANVEMALDSLKEAKPDDFFVVFIAAHGANVPVTVPGSNLKKKEPLFILYDTDPRDWQRTTLKMETFTHLPKLTPARKGLVLTDTCSSAGVQLAGRAGANASLETNEAFIGEMKTIESGIGFMWAAGPLEESLESEDLGHGYFTYCLLEGLRGEADKLDAEGNSGEDGRVTFNELVKYVGDEVPNLTDRKQNPGFTTTATEANYLPLSVVPYTDEDKESAGQYGTLIIRTPDIDGVEVTIDNFSIGKMDSRTQRSIRVKAGLCNLTFSRAGKTVSRQAQVLPRKSLKVEVNLTFSQADDEESDSSSRKINIYLTEDKEPGEEAKSLFQKGVENFNMQKFEAAIDLFKRAAQANGNAFSQAFVYQGRAEQSLGRNRAAIESFQKAIALKPSDYQTQTLLAEARFQNGEDVEGIIQELKAIIARYPDFEVAYVVYADVLNVRGDYRGAEQQLNRAIKIRDKYPPAHLVLADTLTFMKSKVKQKKAIEEADRAIQLFDEVSRKQVSFTRGLGRLSLTHVIFGGGRYLNKAAMSEARYILAKALTGMVVLDDTLAEPILYLDRARTNISEALKLAQALSDKSRLAQLLDLSAQNYLYRGEGPRAIKEAEQALKQMNDYPDALYTLYRAYANEQKCADAARNLKRYIEVLGEHLTAGEQQRLKANLARLNQCVVTQR